MKAVVSIIVCLFIGFGVYGQTNWDEYYNQNGIKISTQDASCTMTGSSINLNYKFIKVENLSQQKARVSYQLEVVYNSHCDGCNGAPEYSSSVVLNAGDSVNGSCTYTVPARLDILVSNSNLPNLQFVSFTITNIQVEWLN